MTQVLLVRPWRDARAGGGCCGGEVRDGVAPLLASEPTTPSCHAPADPGDLADPVGRLWRRLREASPDLDVQVVDAGNVWLPVAVFSAVRRREGILAALRAATGSTTAGSVLVDGVRVGDVEEVDLEGLLARVGRASAR